MITLSLNKLLIVINNLLKDSKIKKVNPVNTTIASAMEWEKIKKKGIE